MPWSAGVSGSDLSNDAPWSMSEMPVDPGPIFSISSYQHRSPAIDVVCYGFGDYMYVYVHIYSAHVYYSLGYRYMFSRSWQHNIAPCQAIISLPG